jgi:hypothetical protein
MKVPFWWLGGALGGTFFVHINLSNYFTFNPPPFKWCPSPISVIFLFSLGAPSSLLESNIKASWGICLCYEGPCFLNANFDLFRNHYYFTSFSSSGFILTLFRFFDGVLTKNRLGFFFRHVHIDIHPFSSPFNWRAFMHGFLTPSRYIWFKGLN